MTRPRTGKSIQCIQCKEEFYRANWNQSRKYCSQKCHYIHKTSNINERQGICKQCHNTFIVKYLSHLKKRKYCSSKCVALSQKAGNVKNCLECNAEIYTMAQENRKFCSVECHNKFQTFEVTSQCPECKIEFSSRKYKNQKYCSIKCVCHHNNKTGITFSQRMNTKPEQKTAKILNDLNIEFIKQKRLSTANSYKHYDFYIPASHLLLEVDGTYWHGKEIPDEELSVTQKHNRENDNMKTELALQQGYTLKRIWSDEITEENIRKLI